MRRRQGFIDPDSWRMSVSAASMGRLLDGNAAARDILSRHHASIRRESVFDDAFDQFYELGEGLKEPIQISFIDKFGATEAGIDGGGVTKEFLTMKHLCRPMVRRTALIYSSKTIRISFTLILRRWNNAKKLCGNWASRKVVLNL